MTTIPRHRRSDRYKEAAISTPETSLFARDGYTNPIASIGEASTLLTGGQYTRTGLTANYELLTTLYRENWIAKRIIDAPCEDMTRAWYSISSQLDQSRMDELAKAESRHSVKDEITNALRWARLYGGAAALIVIKGQEDMLEEPIDMDMLMPGCFRGLIVLDRWSGIEPGIELEEDMDDTDFGYPKYYDVYADAQRTKRIRVHHSRILRFVGRELPHDDEVNESYWGASELEHIYEELNKRNATSANIAQLVFQANVRTLKMSDMGEMFALGTNAQRGKVVEAVAQQNKLLSSFGVQVLNATDSYENHPYTFSGISDVYESFMMDMSGAAEIPATKLFGRSPQGMNATGESDMKMYYERISQLQEKNLRPPLEKLLPIMAMSCWGAIPDDMEIVFEPIQTTTPAERAQIASQLTTAITGAVAAGVISPAIALKELRETGKDIGFWTNITDEDIDKAEQEADQGEMQPEGSPLGGMPPDPNDPSGGGQPNPPGAPTGSAGQPSEPPAPGKPPTPPSPSKAIPPASPNDAGQPSPAKATTALSPPSNPQPAPANAKERTESANPTQAADDAVAEDFNENHSSRNGRFIKGHGGGRHQKGTTREHKTKRSESSTSAKLSEPGSGSFRKQLRQQQATGNEEQQAYIDSHYEQRESRLIPKDFPPLDPRGANEFKKGFTTDNAEEHKQKHDRYYGGLTMEQYEHKAKKLLSSSVGKHIGGFLRSDGNLVRYNTKTRDYAVGHPEIGIITMFKATENYLKNHSEN